MKNKAYQVVMSKGDPVPIDMDELEKVMKGVSSGSIVVVRSGVINPSYFISIIKDQKRVQEYLEDTKLGTQEEVDEQRKNGVERLKDIFSHTAIENSSTPQIESKQ